MHVCNMHLVYMYVCACVSMHSLFQIHVLTLGMVGLAISYALSVTTLLSGAVTSFTETEKQMVSVERVEQYINGIRCESIESSAEVRN